MAFNPEIHKDPNFKFLTFAEIKALDDEEWLDYNFEEMSYLMEILMAGIDPYTIPYPHDEVAVKEEKEPDDVKNIENKKESVEDGEMNVVVEEESAKIVEKDIIIKEKSDELM